MELEKLDRDFSVCKVESYSQVSLESEYCFIGKTDTERSLVCLTRDVPEQTVAREDGWKGLRVSGVLEFSLVGILARISSVLAEAGVSIFALSTYNTDYILIKETDYPKALSVLEGAGYTIID